MEIEVLNHFQLQDQEEDNDTEMSVEIPSRNQDIINIAEEVIESNDSP